MNNPILDTAIEKLGSNLQNGTGSILTFLPEIRWKNPMPGRVNRKKIS